jgi:hypothetical protein
MTEDRWEIFGDYDDDVKFNEGVKAERERIIALLTETYKGLKAVLAMAHPEGDGSEIVALIKGEN